MEDTELLRIILVPAYHRLKTSPVSSDGTIIGPQAGLAGKVGRG